MLAYFGPISFKLVVVFSEQLIFFWVPSSMLLLCWQWKWFTVLVRVFTYLLSYWSHPCWSCRN